MSHVAPVCTPCYMLFRVVAQNLKLVKLLATCKRAQQLPIMLCPFSRGFRRGAVLQGFSASETRETGHWKLGKVVNKVIESHGVVVGHQVKSSNKITFCCVPFISAIGWRWRRWIVRWPHECCSKNAAVLVTHAKDKKRALTSERTLIH